jgi:hypothetical protein
MPKFEKGNKIHLRSITTGSWCIDGRVIGTCFLRRFLSMAPYKVSYRYQGLTRTYHKCAWFRESELRHRDS